MLEGGLIRIEFGRLRLQVGECEYIFPEFALVRLALQLFSWEY